MKPNQALINFMRKCLQYEDLVLTWGISQIQITDLTVSFNVSGFNYSGKIIIQSEKDNKTLVAYSSIECIGSAKNAMDIIKLIDKYIESNEDKYLIFLNSLKKMKIIRYKSKENK